MTKKQIRCVCGRRFTVRCECDNVPSDFRRLICDSCVVAERWREDQEMVRDFLDDAAT